MTLLTRFVYKYLAVFESATQAVSSVLNLSSSYPQEAQDTIKAVFNSVLGSVFNEDSFASSLRHPRYFSKPTSVDEIIQLSIETWLYDSKPVIGEVYREIVDQIYKQNLLIKNDILIGNDSIDLANITMPVLNIVGKKDLEYIHLYDQRSPRN